MSWAGLYPVKRLYDGGVLGGAFHHREGMFLAFAINANSRDKHQVILDVKAVDLDRQQVKPGQVRVHPLLHLGRRQRHKMPRGRRFRRAIALFHRQIALRQAHGAAEFAGRHIDEHQVHRPFAKPVFFLRRRPTRQGDFLAGLAAHTRTAHAHLAAVKANRPDGRAPAVAFAPSGALMPPAAQRLGILIQHLFQRRNSGDQAEPVKARPNLLKRALR